jgi:hypothetical protein
MSNVPGGAQRSEDGSWWWDGSAWQPVEGGASESYAATAFPGDQFRTPPSIENPVSEAWDYVEEKAGEAWDWASGGSDTDTAPPDGGGGGEGAPPYYDGGGGAGGYGPSDAGLPGGVPDHALCGEGACPVCASDRQMSCACVLESGHGGDHQCGYGDLFSAGTTDIPKPPPLPLCRTVCSVCGQTCMLVLGHGGAHGCGH